MAILTLRWSRMKLRNRRCQRWRFIRMTLGTFQTAIEFAYIASIKASLLIKSSCSAIKTLRSCAFVLNWNSSSFGKLMAFITFYNLILNFRFPWFIIFYIPIMALIATVKLAIITFEIASLIMQVILSAIVALWY
jgi:hypothetical protein